MRPLFYDFEDDDACILVDDQFMFGPEIMVAPVLFQGAVERTVYLPEGEQWTDAWTGAVLESGQVITAQTPLDRIPVYLRAPTIHCAHCSRRRVNGPIDGNPPMSWSVPITHRLQRRYWWWAYLLAGLHRHKDVTPTPPHFLPQPFPLDPVFPSRAEGYCALQLRPSQNAHCAANRCFNSYAIISS